MRIFLNGANIISFLLLIVSIGMLIAANQERVSAKTALDEAQRAAEQAENAKGTSINVLKVIKTLVDIHDTEINSYTLNYNPIAEQKSMLINEINKVLKNYD